MRVFLSLPLAHSERALTGRRPGQWGLLFLKVEMKPYLVLGVLGVKCELRDVI